MRHSCRLFPTSAQLSLQRPWLPFWNKIVNYDEIKLKLQAQKDFLFAVCDYRRLIKRHYSTSLPFLWKKLVRED